MTTFSTPKAEQLVESLVDTLSRTPSIPTAIMAGHEVVSRKGEYSDVFGVFPETTRAIGKAIVERTRDRMASIKLFALINDWYELRHLPEEDRNVVRTRHWDDPKMAFAEESDPAWQAYLLRGRGVKKSQRPMGRFSEYVLQQSFRSKCGERGIGRLSQECNLCSSEIVMMATKLYGQGIRRIVSFIPNVCTRAVDQGSLVLAGGVLKDQGIRFDEGPMNLTNVYLNVVYAWDEDDVLRGASGPITYTLDTNR